MGLDTVELLITWEKEFHISIPNVVVDKLITPTIAADATEEILIAEGRVLERRAIEDVIKATTLEISGLNPSRYDPSLEFVRDIGLD